MSIGIENILWVAAEYDVDDNVLLEHDPWRDTDDGTDNQGWYLLGHAPSGPTGQGSQESSCYTAGMVEALGPGKPADNDHDNGFHIFRTEITMIITMITSDSHLQVNLSLQ